MDIFVCGEALWISCGTWLGLLNGGIGAFIAAVIGGLVALSVVRLSSVQTTKHAERAEQAAAISNFVAASEYLKVGRSLEHAARPDDFLALRSAWTRLRMSGDDASPLARILESWPEWMVRMSNVYVVAREKKSKDEWEFYDDLSQPIDLLTEHVIGWSRAGAKERQRILALLEEQTRLMKVLDVDAREAWTIRPDSKSITFWERAREWLTVWPALTAYTVQWSISTAYESIRDLLSGRRPEEPQKGRSVLIHEQDYEVTRLREPGRPPIAIHLRAIPTDLTGGPPPIKINDLASVMNRRRETR